jgi:hypothetical protein
MNTWDNTSDDLYNATFFGKTLADMGDSPITLSQLIDSVGAEDIFLDGLDGTQTLLLSEDDSFDYKKRVYDEIQEMLSIMSTYGLNAANSPVYKELETIFKTLEP